MTLVEGRVGREERRYLSPDNLLYCWEREGYEIQVDVVDDAIYLNMTTVTASGCIQGQDSVLKGRDNEEDGSCFNIDRY